MMATALPPPVIRTDRLARQGGRWASGNRALPEESAVAITYNRITHAVMMATPADLEDFAIGFSLAEHVVARAQDIIELEIIPVELGIEARMWIDPARMADYADRRRHIAGATGCGMCGMESLSEAARPAAVVTGDLRLSPAQIAAAAAALPALQTLNHETRAVHAAGFWTPGQGMVAVREDVGRHNALDKLAGALARQGVSGRDGVVLLTSRISVEMVQKAATMGASILVAVSAPTALAVRTAQSCGMTLIAVARGHDFEAFTHVDRLMTRSVRDVA
jgi:FdhD protein